MLINSLFVSLALKIVDDILHSQYKFIVMLHFFLSIVHERTVSGYSGQGHLSIKGSVLLQIGYGNNL